MSTVLYECPHPDCDARLFAEPGGTKLHCRRHTDTVYEQVEEYHGPNFEFIDPSEGKPLRTQTHVQTGNVGNIKTVTKEPAPEHVSEEVILERLRDRYRILYKEEADKRYGTKRLRTLVKIREQELEEKTKAEFEDKKG